MEVFFWSKIRLRIVFSINDDGKLKRAGSEIYGNDVDYTTKNKRKVGD